MMDWTKRILNNKDYKKIIENILSLFSLQGLSYLLPLITFPYLTRVLGPDNYGLIAFSGAFIGYFQIFTDYGFNLSATREISINKEDPKKISKIFSEVMITKLLLLVISFLLMSIIVFSFSKFRNNWILYFFTFGLVIGNLLLPSWFFQGMEKMKYISILNIGISIIFTVSIFIFIKGSSDFILVPLINSIGSIIMGIIALRIIFKDFNIKFTLPSSADIKYQLYEGWHIFISTFAVSLYTISNTFILGFFASNIIVGYYSVAERIIRMVMGLQTPISQSIYPHISSLIIKSKEDGIEFIKKITKIIGIISLIFSILLFIFAGLVVTLLAGTQYNESINLIRILSFLPFIVALSNMFGVQTMLTLNYKKAFSRIIIMGSIINIVLALLLTPLYTDVGISISFLTTEIFITITMFIYLQKKGIKIMGDF
ncbi:MAG: flippase [Methanobacterium sp.]|nr:flippase [Methanobacterium sp.]